MSHKTFHLVPLGCAKNNVDADSMAQLLASSGYRSVAEASEARVVIVNTCGFIGPAKEESISVLKELASQKRRGQILIAAGCLTQRYRGRDDSPWASVKDWEQVGYGIWYPIGKEPKPSFWVVYKYYRER